MMAAPSTTYAEVFSIPLKLTTAENIFAFYVGALLLLAYFLSLTVSSLHVRQDPVVYPLSRPPSATSFYEYIIMLKTSLYCGSSFDERGRITLQLLGSFADSPILVLKKGKGIEFFLERGATNIFVYHSSCNLGDILEVTFTLINDTPHEIPYVEWHPSYISIMQPATRLQWGTRGSKMRCKDVLNVNFTCVKKRRDRYGILKSLCLFDIWISMFHSPIRIGTYNNFVNVIMVFFVISGILTTVLLTELAFRIKVLPNTPSILQQEGDGLVLRMLSAVGAVWVLEIIFEALFRNTVPTSTARKYSRFRGLVEPVESQLGLHDFSIEYDWDKIWPLIPKKRVIVPYGTRHDSARSIFRIQPVHSYFNYWGLIGLEEEREGYWYTRIMSFCALPLPLSMKWLGKEAWELKEEKLVKQFTSGFQNQLCFFCCWLQDWPLHFVEDPQQAGLIFSHIICKDILCIMKISNMALRARLAQLCLHQWNGLLGCLILYAIKNHIEKQKNPSTQIKSFIYRTILVFGKRSAREIQAAWKKRQKRFKEMQLQNVNSKALQGLDSKIAEPVDTNESAARNFATSPLTFVRNLFLNWRRPPQAFSPQVTYMPDILEVMDCFEDQLDFDHAQPIFEPQSNRGVSSKHLPTFSLVGEGATAYKKKEVEESTNARKRKLPCSIQRFSSIKEEEEMIGDSNVCLNLAGNIRVDNVHQPVGTSLAGSDVVSLTEVSVHSYSSSNVTVFADRNTNAKAGDDLATNTNANAIENEALMEEGQEKEDEANKALAAVLAQKQQESKAEIEETNLRQGMHISEYEEVVLGPMFDQRFAMRKDSDEPKLYHRHRDEILGYCCGSKRCSAYADIHKKVGHHSLGLIKKIIQGHLHFASLGNTIEQTAELWKRKQMVLAIYHLMEQKATLYTGTEFKGPITYTENGFACNKLVTECLTLIEQLTNVVSENRQTFRIEQAQIRRRKFGVRIKPKPQCVFCAKIIQNNDEVKITNKGCDKMDKLVKFFTRDTICVAEKEINIELTYKITIQNYCAMMMNVAKKEVMMELEDPPGVLASKVTRAMTYKLLEAMSPRVGNIQNITEADLSKIGNRRDRIQARNEYSKSAQKDTWVSIKKKKIIQGIVEVLCNKWRVTVKENELNHCALLLAQCLVQERILGFSIYTGMISREHEILLDHSRDRLREIESKAYTTILKIAKKVLKPRLLSVLDSATNVDVLFPKIKMEEIYLMEAISVMQVTAEPTFLKTCTYFINDIVEVKIREFKELMGYLKKLKPAKDIDGRLKLKMLKPAYKIDESFTEVPTESHQTISSPLLRWGPNAIKGVPPLPPNLKLNYASSLRMNEILPKLASLKTLC
ncbi:uncharacterized protein LOC131951266 isoform X2 [Physella acuta]|uniref:uncharacterized protein LOC131951266 isoform X2 n=1 Tax=Physella acuta TaxID=109671 RepID=UPI0027DCA788|nr:uncharacterized protein LOC131951266 isoform X2 [Physella acuta]